MHKFFYFPVVLFFRLPFPFHSFPLTRLYF
jgi:hypothetical protein